MKIGLILLVFVVASLSTDLSELRKLYPKAADNKENAEAFYLKTTKMTAEDVVVVGYKGVGLTLKAKFEKELAKKKNHFKKGVELLEESIEKDPQNIELRTLRLSVQENSPKILNYHKNIDEDKKTIHTYFSKSKNETKVFVAEFIRVSKSFSEEEKKTYKL